jgi:hypothetical protein
LCDFSLAHLQTLKVSFNSFQVVKGFSFVEFDKPEYAANALKALVLEKSRLRPDMDPAELQSVKTFVAEQEQQNAEKEASHSQVTNLFCLKRT